jgi:uncharacterized protein DUF4136
VADTAADAAPERGAVSSFVRDIGGDDKHFISEHGEMARRRHRGDGGDSSVRRRDPRSHAGRAGRMSAIASPAAGTRRRYVVTAGHRSGHMHNRHSRAIRRAAAEVRMTHAFRQRHHRFSTVLLAVVLVVCSHFAIAGQQPKYGVSVKASKPAALAKASTYSWTKSQPSFDKDVDRQITAAVDRELGARGLTKVASGPSDVVVTYASLSRTDADVKSKPSATGALREYAVGTLLVDVRNSANSDSLFRVRMDTPIDKDPAKREEAINAAVAAMFEKYPKAPAR